VTARRSISLAALLAVVIPLSGCRQDMHDQPKYEPYEASRFFADGRTARPQIEGTVARGWLQEDDALYRGLDENGQFVTSLPIWLEADLLARGQERFEIFCSPCHGRTGDGQGMIVQRGFKQPETFHQTRLREMPVGYFFDVMTNGFGEMSSYASQVPTEDRWAIAGFIQALQASRFVDVATLPAEDREAVRNGTRVSSAPVSDSGHGSGHGDGHGNGHDTDGHSDTAGTTGTGHGEDASHAADSH